MAIGRRLVAIRAADAARYSRVMAADDEGCIAQLKAHRKALIKPETAERRGRVVKLMGDGALIEFASVVDAVTCAAEARLAMMERDAGVPEDQQSRRERRGARPLATNSRQQGGDRSCRPI